MDELDGALIEGAVYYADTKGHEECKKKATQKPELNGEVFFCIRSQACSL